MRWYGPEGGPDFSQTSHSIAYFLSGASHGDADLYILINAWWKPLTFAIQEGRAGTWQRVIDTTLPTPHDIADPGTEPFIQAEEYEAGPRSLVVLMRAGASHPPA